MFSQLTQFLDVISPWALLLFFWVKGKDLRQDYIFWFIVFQTIINTISIIYDKILVQNNLFWYNLNCAGSFLILTVYFSTILNNYRIHIVVCAALILYSIFYAVNLLKWETLEAFNSLSFSVASIIIVIYSFLYYLENLLTPATIDIAKAKDFWYVTGLFTYYSGSFFIFVTFRKLTSLNIKDLAILWQTHNILFLVLCLFLAKGVTCQLLPRKFNL